MKEKWVKLHSKFLNWEWYKDKNTKILFIHCLLKANWKDGRFEGMVIPRGSFVTSLDILAKELSLTVQEIRTALKHLISTNVLTSKSTNKYRVITVVSYELYQASNNQATSNQQATNMQKVLLLTIKNFRRDLYFISKNIDKHIVINKQQENLKIKKIKNLTTIEEYKTINNIISSSYIEEMRTRVYQFYETNFAKLLSPIEKEELDDWIDYFQNEEILKYGIRIAVLNRVATMNYLNGIYQNWKDNEYRTLEQCKPKQKKEKEKIELFDYDWFEDEEPH